MRLSRASQFLARLPDVHSLAPFRAAKLLGQSDVSTTMIYTHVLELAGGGVRSPLDDLVAP